MKRNLLLWLLVFVASCKDDAGTFSDPPPSPRLSVQEARRQADLRSRQEQAQESGQLTPDEQDELPQTGPGPKVRSQTPTSTTRPLSADELKLVHDALAPCSEAAATVNVMVEPGGVVFLAPGQRFLEADLNCYAQKLGTVRLAADVARKGTITLP